jgi:hypothetical protein
MKVSSLAYMGLWLPWRRALRGETKRRTAVRRKCKCLVFAYAAVLVLVAATCYAATLLLAQ